MKSKSTNGKARSLLLALWILTATFILILIRFYWSEVCYNLLDHHYKQTFTHDSPSIILYVDGEEEKCSRCFSELLLFEKLKVSYPKSSYKVIVGYTTDNPSQIQKWIRENITNSFSSEIIIDKHAFFKERLNLSRGSKVIFLDRESQVINTSKTEELSLKDYLFFYKENWY